MAFADVTPRVVSAVATPVKVTLAGTVVAGDLIGFTTGWVQAVASATAPIAARLVAIEDGVSGDIIDATPFAAITSYTGGTAGSQLFLSSTAGGVKESVTGSVYQKVGMMVSATVGMLYPGITQELGVTNVARSTDDTRTGYFRLYEAVDSASGDALRAYNTVLAGITATGAHGFHASVSFNAGASVTGLACGLRATLDFAANTASPNGTYCALQVDSNIGTGITPPAGSTSFIRVANNGAVAVPNLLEMPAPSNGSIFAAHTTQTMSHSIKFIAGGTAYYIMCTDAATNRS